MITQKRQFGDLGEKTAARYLQDKGYKILGTNFQNKMGRKLGEIDIIAKDKEEIVFVEVKTRDYAKYSDTLPEENINYWKLQRLAKTANLYLRQNRLEKAPFRFDAISVWLDREEKKAKIKHISHL